MPKTYGKNLLWWGTDMETATLEQAYEVAQLPFIAGHAAQMADGHVGFGSTVGLVIPTQGAVIPGAVGVDIGCGMIAILTVYTLADLPDDLGALRDDIMARIPAGVGKGHLEIQDIPDDIRIRAIDAGLTDAELDKAHRQYGSLGSGNHFLELSFDAQDRVWIVLHSGSRGPGNMIASRHIEKAKGLMKQYFIEVDPDLAYFAEGTPEFDAYIRDMRWAQDYAAENRERMANQALIALTGALGFRPGMSHPHDAMTERVNCHHNYTTRENHHGRNIWVTRKGAIDAHEGRLGVIPGSMGTDTFIVRGLGNPASYCSSSHGAGRKMSRTQARKELSVTTFREQMAGKTWNDDASVALIDEAPSAYKDINQVMRDQADLTEVVHRLTQVLNYKGFDSGRKRKGDAHQ